MNVPICPFKEVINNITMTPRERHGVPNQHKQQATINTQHYGPFVGRINQWWRQLCKNWILFKMSSCIHRIFRCYRCLVHVNNYGLTHWPRGHTRAFLKMQFSNSFYILIDKYFLWKCSHVNATEPIAQVNICSVAGLVPSGNKPLPEPMLNQKYIAIWRDFIHGYT